MQNSTNMSSLWKTYMFSSVYSKSTSTHSDKYPQIYPENHQSNQTPQRVTCMTRKNKQALILHMNCVLSLWESILNWTVEPCSDYREGSKTKCVSARSAGRCDTSSALTNQEITCCSFQIQVSCLIKALRRTAGGSHRQGVQKYTGCNLCWRSGDDIGDNEVENGWLR